MVVVFVVVQIHKDKETKPKCRTRRGVGVREVYRMITAAAGKLG